VAGPDVSGFVTIGEVVKAVGLRGEVKLYPLLDFHEPLLESDLLVWRDGAAAEVRRHRPMGGGCWALSVDGVTDRNAAEALVGRELGFRRADYARDDFPRPAGGLPFRYLGREVVTGDGTAVGIVDEVRVAGAGHMLVIPDGDREILIPALAPILREDPGTEGPLVVDPPEGLLDVHRE
jgi:16S rRNA processing protein RimM